MLKRFFVFLLFMSMKGAWADQQQTLMEINFVVDEFRQSILLADKERFMRLFLNDKVIWQKVYSPEALVEERLKDANRQRVTFDPASTHQAFIDKIVKNGGVVEEKFHNLAIETDGNIASVVFEFDFFANKKKINFGKEAWHLVNTGQGWRIVSVIYSINSLKAVTP